MKTKKCKHENISKVKNLGRGYALWVHCLDCNEDINLHDYLSKKKEAEK